MYRKFALSNGNNATWDLTDPSFESFASSPTGLGFEAESSYIRVGNDNILTYSQYAMVTKTFEILFYADTLQRKYQMYNDFVRFLMVEPIYLLYITPASNVTYRMKVKVDSLEKGEVSPDNRMLSCPISMTPLSFWEDNIANVIVAEPVPLGEGKTYPLERPYSYSRVGTRDIPIVCNGTLPSPLRFTVDGESEDLTWTLIDANNTPYGIGKIEGTYDVVSINSDEAEESIYLESNGTVVSNPYGYQDLEIGSPDEIQVTFLRLKPVETSHLSFVLPVGFNGNITIEWRNRYLSV